MPYVSLTDWSIFLVSLHLGHAQFYTVYTARDKKNLKIKMNITKQYYIIISTSITVSTAH